MSVSMMRFFPLLGLWALLSTSNAFIPTSLTARTTTNAAQSALQMASSLPGSRGRGNRRSKTVNDRTPAEFQSLVRDIIQTAVDAGPRAGPARTFQAYRAFSETAREFLPRPGRTAEPFSFPKVLRSLFEKMGATYIKLGQFIASSPTLFPKEYVLEFQKCLDATDPLEWKVIEKVIVDELGPISKTFTFIDQKPLASASIAQVLSTCIRNGKLENK
jgi:aarF domain-containing kinase